MNFFIACLIAVTHTVRVTADVTSAPDAVTLLQGTSTTGQAPKLTAFVAREFGIKGPLTKADIDKVNWEICGIIMAACAVAFAVIAIAYNCCCGPHVTRRSEGFPVKSS